MPCHFCGRVQTDPVAKQPVTWLRGVIGGEQVLVCPDCATNEPRAAAFDRCDRCGSTRLSITLGSVVCRSCGAVDATP